MNYLKQTVLVLLCALATHSYALEFVVGSTTDAIDANPGDGVCATEDSECTLRAAVMEANASAGTDSIVLAAEEYFLSIPGIEEEESLLGDLDVFDDLILQGNGATLNGALLDRLFDLEQTTMSIFDLTITGGEPPGGGGAIRAIHSSVQLQSVHLTSNEAGGDGGGLMMLGGELVASDLSFDANSAIAGGGLYADSINLTLSTASFTNNASVEGGALYLSESKSIVITDTIIAENFAMSLGGGILLSGYTNSPTPAFTLNGVQLINNLAINEEGGGGGLFVLDLLSASRSATLELTDCLIQGNRASSGAGVWIDDGVVSFNQCTFENNSTIGLEGVGGGIYQAQAAQFQNVTMRGNLANEFGGAVYSEVLFDATGIDAQENLSRIDVLGRGVYTVPVIDRDADGVPDYEDVFPDDPTEFSDNDRDGLGDFIDLDDDADGVPDRDDDYPLDGLLSMDVNDADGDGVGDVRDVFPDDPNESFDVDMDGIGDNADTDDDADGFSDVDEVAVGSNPANPADTPTLHRPTQPQITSIAFAADTPFTFLLVGMTAFVDPDGDQFPTEVIWRVLDENGMSTLYSRRSGDETALDLPPGLLSPGQSYRLVVRTVDSTGLESDESEGALFATLEEDPLDIDGDGIVDASAFEGTSDTNNNGTDDSEENLLILGDGNTGQPVGLALSDGVFGYATTSSLDEVPADVTPPGEMPYGLFGFRIDNLEVGAEVEVTFHLPDQLDAPEWYQYDSQLGFIDLTSVSVFEGARVIVTLTDGGLGDLDGVANGAIIDPSGPVGAVAREPAADSDGDSRCFVATAVFGPQARETNVLREFRDQYLQNSAAGRRFVGWYYASSPAWVSWSSDKPTVRSTVRVLLTPVVEGAALLTGNRVSSLWLYVLLFGALLTYRHGLSRLRQVRH